MKIVKSLVAVAVAFGSLILPSGLRADAVPQYRLAEWIESTGKQYFDTEFVPDGTAAKAELKFLHTASSGENWALANFGGGFNWRVGTTSSKDNFNRAALANYSLAVSSTGGTGTLSSYLFAQHVTSGSGVQQLGGHVRLWFCRMWNNAGELARDFVPAQRISDGTMGLLDRARGIFVEAMGTDTDKFLSGALGFDIVVPIAAAESETAYSFAAPAAYTDEEGRVRTAVSWAFTAADGSVISGSGSTAEFSTAKAGVLVWAMYADEDTVGFADEYREVEYIESNGGQFLDTGYVPNAKTVCEVKCKQITSKGENVAIGIWGEIMWRGRTDQNSGNGFTRSTVDGWYLLKSSAGSASGAKVAAMLFAQNAKGIPASNNTNIRLVSCKFTEDGVPVMDLAPAVRVSDGRAGLYDRVSGKFIEDNLGTAPFAVGPETGVCWVNVQRFGTGQAIDLSRPEVDTSLNGMQRYVASGWTFVDVDGAETQGEGATCKFNFTKPGQLTWSRSPSSVKIVVTSGEHGTVMPAEQWCEPGETAEFTFAADPGYGFSGFTGDLVTPERSFIVEKPLRLTANFEAGKIAEFYGVEYLDSNGRYFDTDFTPNGNKSFVSFEHKYLTYSTTSADSNWAFGFYISDSPWRTGLAVDGYTYKKDGAFMYEMCGDHTIVTSTNFAGASSISCYLCAQHLSSGKQGSATFRIYSCKLGDQGGLKRDYVPAKDANGVVGLFDQVNGSFDEGLGTGDLTCGERSNLAFSRISGYEPGEELSVEAPADYTDAAGHKWEVVSWRLRTAAGVIAEGTGKSAGIVMPGGVCVIEWRMFCADDLSRSVERYHVVNYAESTGSQAVNTDYIPNGKTSCECRAYQVQSAGENIALGIWSAVYWRARLDQNSANGFTRSAAGDGWYLLSSTTGAAGADVPVVLFSQNTSTGPSFGPCVRVAYATFKEDGELVHDYVPVIRESDGSVGFYDKACGVFHATVTSSAKAVGLSAGDKAFEAWDDISVGKVGEAMTVVGPEGGSDPAETVRYEVSGWEFVDCDGESVSGEGSTASFTYQKPGRITWKYRRLYPVTVKNSVHCTVTPETQWGAEGDAVAFTVTPDAGYEFYKVTAGENECFEPSIVVDQGLEVTVYCRKHTAFVPTGDGDDVALQRLIDTADVGDVIEIAAGDCELNEAVFVTNEVQIVGSFDLKVYKRQGVTDKGFFYVDKKNAAVSGISIENRYKESISVDGAVTVVNGSVSDIRISGLTASCYWVYVRNNGLVKNCEISGCGGKVGYGSVYVTGGTFANARIHDCSTTWGVLGVFQTGGTVMNVAIYKNRTYYETRAGIWKSGGETFNCTVFDCFSTSPRESEKGKSCGLVQTGGKTYNCIFWGCGSAGAESSVNVTGGTFLNNVNETAIDGNFTFDPMMKHPENGDFRLRASSPCIDKGKNADWMEDAVDLLGKRRIVNEIVDIGCCEAPQNGLVIFVR